MTTKASGGNITGLLALTMEAQEALNKGDAVHLVGDYEVEAADGTKPILGYVSVSNKRGRNSTVMGTSVGNAVVPGDVTVETPGFFVREMELGATVDAGDEVGIGVGGPNIVVPAGANVATIGIALTGGDDGDNADILWR